METEAEPLYILPAERTRWLQTLTVGADLLVTYGSRSFPAQILGITKSRRFRVHVPGAEEETWEFGSDGWILGAQKWTWRLEPAESELRIIVAHRERVKRLSETRWAELPAELVERVVALLATERENTNG